MKTTLLMLLVLLQMGLNAQFFTDTLTPFTVTTWNMDNAPIPCYPYKSQIGLCHYWGFPNDLKGGFYAYDEAGSFEIVVFDSSRWVVMDTIVTLDTFPFGFQLHCNFPSSSQLMICGTSGKRIDLDIKPDPSGLLNNFGARLIDIDTLCATGIESPEIAPKFIYFDPYTLEQVVNLRPNTAYLKRKKQ